MRSRPGVSLWFGQVREEHGFALANSINYVLRFSTVKVTYNYCYRYYEGPDRVIIIIGTMLTLYNVYFFSHMSLPLCCGPMVVSAN